MKEQSQSRNTAVIVIDMQDFFLKKFEPKVLDVLIQDQLELIDFCVHKKFPFIVVEYKAGGKFRGKTIKKLDDRIKGGHKETFIKEHNSAFTKTRLDQTLKNLKIKEIVLMGINANACVQDTAIAALCRGYKVITGYGITGCASSKSLELSKRNREWYVNHVNFFGGVKEIIEYLS